MCDLSVLGMLYSCSTSNNVSSTDPCVMPRAGPNVAARWAEELHQQHYSSLSSPVCPSCQQYLAPGSTHLHTAQAPYKCCAMLCMPCACWTVNPPLPVTYKCQLQYN